MQPRACIRFAVRVIFATGLSFAEYTVHAQRKLPPSVDLFGDAIVRPLSYESGRRVAIRISDEVQAEKLSPEDAAFSDAARHTVYFHSGAELRGEITELSKETVVLKRPDVSEAIRFPRSAISRISLGEMKNNPDRALGEINPVDDGAPNKAEKPVTAKRATVKLPGGDWLHGELESADGRTFSMEVNEGTSFTFQREAIEWIHYGTEPAPAYSFTGDSTALSGWTVGNGSIKVATENGRARLTSQGWFGREMSPPLRFEVAIEVPAPDEKELKLARPSQTQTRLWLQPFTPSPNSYSTGTVELSFGAKELGRLIYINQFKRESTPLPEDDTKGPARYRVFYDGLDDRLIVLRNGKRVGDWPLQEEDKGAQPNIRRTIRRPRGICIDRGYGNEPVELGEFAVRPWNGIVPDENAPALTEARLTLGKEPAKTGALESAKPGELVFAGEKRETTQGTFIEFPKPTAAGAKGDALLTFGSLGEIAAAELEIRDGRVRGKTSIAALDVPVGSLATIVFAPGESPKPTAEDVLVFRDGGLLRGTLLAAGKDAPLRWRTEGGQEISFAVTRLAGVRLGASTKTEVPDGSVVELRNGDRLQGQFAMLDEGSLSLKHTVIGERTIGRGHARNLFPNAHINVADASANPLQWLGVKPFPGRRIGPLPAGMEKGAAKEPFVEQFYLDGHFIARPVRNQYSNALSWVREKAPERFELRATATDTTGADPYFNVNLAGSNGSPSAQITYSYGQLRAYCYNTTGNRGNGMQQNREFQVADKLESHSSRRELRLFVDSTRGTVDMMLDGALVGKLGKQGSDRTPGIGASVNISCYSSTAARIVISDVWMGPWNGELPQSGDSGSVFLANGDTASGKIGGIKDGALLIESDAGPLEIPFERVQSVQFGGDGAPEKAAARLRLTDGSTIHAAEFALEDGRLTARNSVLGDMVIPAGNLAELILNPAPARFPKVPVPPKSAKQGDEKPGDKERAL